jgi:dihydrodipicolinate synthase/N-acetylneuraminate lyase
MHEMRRRTIKTLFPQGIPKLFCPTITHYGSSAMSFDEVRTRKHYVFLSKYVGGCLVPGSTGDGWIMNNNQIMDILLLQCQNVQKYGGILLAGILKPETRQMLSEIDLLVNMVKRHTDRNDLVGFMQLGIGGITVCAPTGGNYTQYEIERALAAILSRGLPTAIYQLPQVTHNEIAPKVLGNLAQHYPNFFLFKDTSGEDRVARSGIDLNGVILVRGAEGDFAQWYKGLGGAYDGFLVSTANVFAPEISEIMRLADAGEKEIARNLSQKLSGLIYDLFKLFSCIKQTNVFASANKALDHLNAYGNEWRKYKLPLNSDGSAISIHIIEEVEKRVKNVFPNHEYSYMLE